MYKIRETITNFAKSTTEWSEGKLSNSISNGRCQKLPDSSPSGEEKGRFFRSFNEYTFLICTVCFSSSIVVLKLLYANRDKFRKIYRFGKGVLNTPFSLTDFNFLPSLLAAFATVWSIIVDLNWLFIPAVVGIATSFITWRLVYWDSRIPGVQPLSPFSPKVQSKIPSFLTLNGYTFALYIGICVFIILVVWGVVST